MQLENRCLEFNLCDDFWHLLNVGCFYSHTGEMRVYICYAATYMYPVEHRIHLTSLSE